MKIKHIAASSLFIGTGLMLSSAFADSTNKLDLNIQKLNQVATQSGLSLKALDASLNAYTWAAKHNKLGANKDTLTIIDFTLPSYDKRLWIIDLKTNQVLMKTYTTQAKNSGLVEATHFSNQIGSGESSLGLYVTSNEYYGHHGKSMRINGLEPGINNNARQRNVVIHSASYVTPQFIKEYHRAGRSLGCFAVAPKIKDKILNDIQGGSVIFAYASSEEHDPIATDGPFKLV